MSIQPVHSNHDYMHLRVVEHPEKPREVLFPDIIERERVDVRCALRCLTGWWWGTELLTEEQRLPLEEISMNSEDVVLDLEYEQASVISVV